MSSCLAGEYRPERHFDLDTIRSVLPSSIVGGHSLPGGRLVGSGMMSFTEMSCPIRHLSAYKFPVSEPRKKAAETQVEPRGKKTTRRVGCPCGHICDHYLKRQDNKSWQEGELGETQAGKRGWDKSR